MPLSSKVLSFFPLLPVLTTSLALSARADDYKLYVVTNTQSENFVMGDDFGDYAFTSSFTVGPMNLCGTSSLEMCYQVGNAITGSSYYSSTVPAPLVDAYPVFGHAALPAGSGWSIDKKLGNLFSGSYQLQDGSQKQGIWDGPDWFTNYLGTGTIDGGFSSVNGNVFYSDGLNNTLVVGIDLQTSPVPELGTLSLTATALLTATFGRRRLLL